VHTLCRLINPFAANATLQSVFHPAYMQTHHQAAALLKEDHAIVFKGDAGEAEYRPHASVKIKQLSRGQSLETTLKRRCTAPIEVKPSAQALIDLWKNDRTDKQTDSAVIDPAVTEYSVNAVLGTTAIALLAMQKAATEQEAFLLAEKLWDARDRNSLG